MDKLKKLLEKLFNEHLTEDGLKKIEDFFEIAVEKRVSQKAEELKLEHQKDKEKTIADLNEDYKKTLDSYCEKAVAEYIKENTIAIESNTKIAMAETLIESLTKSLQQYNYPIEKDVDDKIKNLEENVKKLETEKNILINEQSDFKAQIFETEKSSAFFEITEGMSKTHKEELLELIENVSVKTIDEFKTKVKSLKEKFESVSKGLDKNFNESSKLNKDKGFSDTNDVDQYAPI